MSFSRIIKLLMLVLLASQVGRFFPQAFGFTAAGDESRVEIDSIDIAPTIPHYAPNEPKPTTAPERKPAVPTPVAPSFFSFSVSGNEVDFGTIDPTNPVVRTHQLMVSPGSTSGYQVVAYQNHPLREDDAFIPDTSCDDGKCSEKQASLWASSLTYGLGYRCDNDKQSGSLCDNSFSQIVDSRNRAQYFKDFADVSRKESASVILNRFSSNRAAGAKLTYKLNVPGTQAKGTYTNTFVLIAVPSL
jgi:hypothetical protein